MMQFEASMQNAFSEADGEKNAVSIAKGIAMYQNELSSFQSCFRLADALMYKNKKEMKPAFVEGV